MTMDRSRSVVFCSTASGWLATVFIFSVLCGAQSQTTPFSGISLSTQMRVQNGGWWPTKGDKPREDYVGTAECAKCHAAKAATYKDAAMSQASMHPLQSGSLRQHDRLSFQQGPYAYEWVTTAEGSTLKVTNGSTSISADLLWAFGLGRMGQTPLYRWHDAFYESRVSYYSTPGALDITPGHAREIPGALEDALGRQQEPSEIQRCFRCHTTASTSNDQFDPDHAVPGVSCEACHGPGARHIAAIKAGTENATDLILNPGRLEPVDSVDFCGACHRTWQDVVGGGLMGVGILNIRFAPYRLENSKCWKQQDARITCIACHDPHKPLVRDTSSYDSRCLQCHKLRGAPKSSLVTAKIAACPVATQNCVTCHMPKYEPPNLHSSFTDHWIRIARPGKPYPY
jgi:hypothetical protein